MQCINKIKAGFNKAGELTFKSSQCDPGTVGFELECRKCLPCRLNIAREKSIRAIHEAHEHKHNSFITLTYSDEHLKSPWLQYQDFQDFMKRLRISIDRNTKDQELKDKLYVSYMVTGEYGEQNKRPHWHALLFNYWPSDAKKYQETDLGHQTYTSKILDELWGKNDPKNCPSIIGQVTLDSAGYIARYGSKQLVHGNDQDHPYQPIHKTSSKRAIGRSWIEKYWKQTFDLGYIRLPDGTPTKIPRYYVDWLKKHQPTEYTSYVTTLKYDLQQKAEKKQRDEELRYLTECLNTPNACPRPISRKKVLLTILKQKFKKLMEHTS